MFLFPSSASFTSSSSPLAFHLNCSALPTAGQSQTGLPDGSIVSTSFIERSVYNKRTEQKGKKRKLWRPLFLCQCTLSAGFSNTNSYCGEEIKDTPLNASRFGCCHLKDVTHSTHKSSRCYTVGDMWWHFDCEAQIAKKFLWQSASEDENVKRDHLNLSVQSCVSISGVSLKV